jgi:hypothetical protein
MSMTVQEPNRAGRAGSRGEAEERTDLVERTAAGAHRALRHPAPAYLDETQIVSPPRVAAGERGGSAVRCCAARSRPRRGVDRQVVRSKASAPAGVWAFLGGVAGFVLAAIVNGIVDPDPVSAYKKRHAGAEPSVEVGADDAGPRPCAGSPRTSRRRRPGSTGTSIPTRLFGSSLWAAVRSARDLEQRRQHLDADEAAGTPETELHATRKEIASAGADLDHVEGNPARSAGSPANWDAWLMTLAARRQPRWSRCGVSYRW